MTTTLEDWSYDLPASHIASRPSVRRDGSRLMHLPLVGGAPEDSVFGDLPGFLQPGDLLVVNDSRVMAARLRARRSTGGRVELLLLEPGPGPVRCLAKPARRLKVGEILEIENHGTAEILARPDEDGVLMVQTTPDPEALMALAGELPLPPYMGRSADASDTERYQTVYAGPLGSSAAPTAGLHFTDTLLATLRRQGVQFASVTLHVGLGTFRPLRDEDVARGRLHQERIAISQETANLVAATKARGGRVIAVGTTATRTLEAMAHPDGSLRVGEAVTDLFLQPPYRFRVVQGLITNFHLPRSSLLMLVACLVGRERLLSAYQDAVQRGYRFYSYGDAMLLL